MCWNFGREFYRQDRYSIQFQIIIFNYQIIVSIVSTRICINMIKPYVCVVCNVCWYILCRGVQVDIQVYVGCAQVGEVWVCVSIYLYVHLCFDILCIVWGCTGLYTCESVLYVDVCWYFMYMCNLTCGGVCKSV